MKLQRRNGDIDALTMRGDELLLSTAQKFSADGVFAKDVDVFSFAPTSLVSTSQCAFGDDLFFDGSQFDLARRNLVAIDLSIG